VVDRNPGKRQDAKPEKYGPNHQHCAGFRVVVIIIRVIGRVVGIIIRGIGTLPV